MQVLADSVKPSIVAMVDQETQRREQLQIQSNQSNQYVQSSIVRIQNNIKAHDSLLRLERDNLKTEKMALSTTLTNERTKASTLLVETGVIRKELDELHIKCTGKYDVLYCIVLCCVVLCCVVLCCMCVGRKDSDDYQKQNLALISHFMKRI